MDQLHSKLSKKLDFYKDWHKSERHQAVHWAIFVVIGLFLTAVIVARISGWDPKGLSSHASGFTCDYYASTDGTSTGTGAISNPWDLQTSLNKTALVTAGKTLCLKGGIYKGKFTSNLVGGIVRSAPTQWAKIDGYDTALLVAPMTSTQTTMVVSTSDAAKLLPGSFVTIDDSDHEERIKIGTTRTVNGGTTILTVIRAMLGGNYQPHATGASIIRGGDTLTVGGSDTIYRDFEILNTDPVRRWDFNIITDAPHYRGRCVMQNGPRTKLVNLVVHDCHDGIQSTVDAVGAETYGVISYNNGHLYDDNNNNIINFGNGWTTDNNSQGGSKKYFENITFNNQALGALDGDESGQAVNIDNTGNIFTNNPLMIGHETAGMIDNISVKDNFFYSNSKGAVLGNLRTGSYIPLGSSLIINNYFGIRNDLFAYVEPANLEFRTQWQNLNVMGNTFVNTGTPSGTLGGTMAIVSAQRGSGMYNINNNTYYDQSRLGNCAGGPSRHPFVYIPLEGACGGSLKFSEWKTLSGFDTNSVYTQTAAPNKVFVRPNAYEQGRANVIVYNWSNASTVNVNLSSTGLMNGQPYEIRNVQDYFGAPVATGTYSAANPITAINMNSSAVTSVAQPIGNLPARATTAPEFAVFVVVPVYESITTPHISLSASDLSFNADTTSAPAPQSVTLTNSGITLFNWVAGSTSNWCDNVTPRNGRLYPNQAVNLTLTLPTYSVPGTYHCTLIIQADYADNSPQTINITETVTLPAGSDITPPSVSMTAPANGSNVSGSSVVVSANAIDNVGVAGVQFILNEDNLGVEDTIFPYSVNWNSVNVPNGYYVLTAKARDAAGNTKISAPAYVQVYNTQTPPAPSSPQLFLEPTSVNFEAVSEGSTPDSQSVRLTNRGTATSNWRATSSEDWCHVKPGSNKLAAGVSQALTVYVDAPSRVGNFTCNITFSDQSTDGKRLSLRVNYNVSDRERPGSGGGSGVQSGPELQVAPSSDLSPQDSSLEKAE